MGEGARRSWFHNERSAATGDDPMLVWKTIAAHLMTVAVTLALVTLLSGGRLSAQRQPGIPAPPRPRALPQAPARAGTQGYQLPAVPAPAIAPEILKAG